MMNLEDIISGQNGCVCSGSGSCDFSTATVHVVNNTGGLVTGSCPLVDTFDGATYTATSFYIGEEEEEKDVTVILYGNNGAALTFTDVNFYTYATSGNIERIDPVYPAFVVSGDCTVTVSQEQNSGLPKED